MYKFVKAPENYPGKTYTCGNRILEHHLVWWQNTGEVVDNEDIIHHKNEIKSDNRFSNLIRMPRGEHTIHHFKIYDDVELECDCCGKSFIRSGRLLQKAKSFYCSRRCAAMMTMGIDRIKGIYKNAGVIKEMRASGMSSYLISKNLGISRNTVMKYWN